MPSILVDEYLVERYSTLVGLLFCGPSLVLYEFSNVVRNGSVVPFATIFGALRLHSSRT